MFEPANGHTSRLDTLIKFFDEAPYGTLVTYKELEEALSDEPGTRYARSLVHQTMPLVEARLTREHSRVVRVRNNVGYEVLDPDKMNVKVHDRLRRGKRQFGKARRTAKAVPIELLSSTEDRERALATQDITQRAHSLYVKAERDLKRKSLW